MTYDPKLIGRRVREARSERGLTQAELAELAELAFETISRIERGREPPSLRTMVALADALGTGVDALLGRAQHEVTRPERLSPETRRLAAALERLDPRVARQLVALVRTLAAAQRRRA